MVCKENIGTIPPSRGRRTSGRNYDRSMTPTAIAAGTGTRPGLAGQGVIIAGRAPGPRRRPIVDETPPPPRTPRDDRSIRPTPALSAVRTASAAAPATPPAAPVRDA